MSTSPVSPIHFEGHGARIFTGKLDSGKSVVPVCISIGSAVSISNCACDQYK